MSKNTKFYIFGTTLFLVLCVVLAVAYRLPFLPGWSHAIEHRCDSTGQQYHAIVKEWHLNESNVKQALAIINGDTIINK